MVFLGMKLEESDAVNNNLVDFVGAVDGDGKCCGFRGVEDRSGDSNIEHNFLTLPLNELPAGNNEPKDELYKVLIEPFLWSVGELYRLHRGSPQILSAVGEAEELIVTERFNIHGDLFLLLLCWPLRSAIK